MPANVPSVIAYGSPEDEKLALIASPLVPASASASRSNTFEQEPHIQELGFRHDDTPEFTKHEEATNIEIFFDLFFAANLSVFAEAQDVTSLSKVATFIVYFSLLWFNWLLLSLYDVRFVTDSIFERCARAIHLGVMVGFAVVAPKFQVGEQIAGTFQTMSIALMASRLTLALQYASIVWHTRAFKSSRLPLLLMVAANFVAAMIYLGLGFAFTGSNTGLFAVWFVLAAVEAVFTFGVGLKWKVMSFMKTHLVPRISLLTFIFIGEGVVAVCLSVTRIVSADSPFTSPTIGNITAGVANLYIIYMMYFDWRRSLKLGEYMQLIWCNLHYPFLLACKLFIEGSSQFVIWWKAFETITEVDRQMTQNLMALEETYDPSKHGTMTDFLADTLNATAYAVYKQYRPKFYHTVVETNTYIERMKTEFDDAYFDQALAPGGDPSAFVGLMNSLINTIMNSLFATFKIQDFSNFDTTDDYAYQQINDQVTDTTFAKFRIVFRFGFVAGGLMLMLMNTLFILGHPQRWTPFNIARKTFNYLIGLGMCLVPLIGLREFDPENEESYVNFESTPWPLPTILLTLFVVLIINHLPAPPPIFFSGGKKTAAKDEYEAVTGLGFRRASDDASSAQDSKKNIVADVQETDTAYRGANAA
ncbi:hypothetical protein OQA88_8671 [Cercophora sp. LCS_1]